MRSRNWTVCDDYEHLRPMCNDLRILHKFFADDCTLQTRRWVCEGLSPAMSCADWWHEAQQLGKAVEAATAPHQHALSTKAGCECIAHILQGLTGLDDRATVISVDGVSAFDLISRTAMMRGLLLVEGGSQALPFIRMFYGAPSEYLWEDSSGTVHTIPQGEGGE